MASHNSKFILNNFVLTGVQGIDMSSYIRKYAHYLNEKRETYKLMGFDFSNLKTYLFIYLLIYLFIYLIIYKEKMMACFEQ